MDRQERHKIALKKALDGDTSWFEKNPTRRFRLRKAILDEFEEKLGKPIEGHHWHVITFNVNLDLRLRFPLMMPDELAKGDVTDAMLQAALLDIAPDNMKPTIRQAKILAQ